MLQAIKGNIPLLPAHLVGPGAVAFEVLVYLDGGVPRAASQFGLRPFRHRGNQTPEHLDHCKIRSQCPEAVAGTTQVRK